MEFVKCLHKFPISFVLRENLVIFLTKYVNRLRLLLSAVKTQKLKVCHSLYQCSWKGWIKTRGTAKDWIKEEMKGIRLTTFFLLKATISEGDWSRSLKKNTIETKERHREIWNTWIEVKGTWWEYKKKTQLKLLTYGKFNPICPSLFQRI